MKQSIPFKHNASKSTCAFPHIFAKCQSNRELAMLNFGKLPDVYAKYLHIFFTSYSDSPAKMQDLIDAGHIDEAIRLAHSIKGLSATLGLMCLNTASDELCAALKKEATASPLSRPSMPKSESERFETCMKKCVECAGSKNG